MINIDSIVVKDFLAFSEAARSAHEQVMNIRTGMKRKKETNLTDEMIKAELTPMELKFAEKNYYIFPESSRF